MRKYTIPRCLAFWAIAACLYAAGFVRADAPATAPAAPPATEDVRKAFLAVIDRPRVELAPRQERQPAEAGAAVGTARFNFTYASEAGERVPGILLAKEPLLADGHRHPAVIVLHGTGGKKESELGTLRRLADKGFVAVAIDGRYHGERGNQADYNAAIAKAFAQGGAHPLYYDTVWDVMRLIDYLQSRPDVDGGRIGLMGISKGGIETWLTAAADPRVATAVPCISVQSFEWALEHDAWRPRVGTVRKGFDAAAKSAGVDNPDAAFVRRFYDRVIPGIYDRFDGPVMLTLIAPRPLLIINGETDNLNPLPALELCSRAAKAAYAAAGSAEKFERIVEPATGHTVTPAAESAAIDWFSKWLGDAKDKPAAPAPTSAASHAIDDSAIAPEVLPGGGLSRHDFFYAGEAKSRTMFIVRKGRVVWSYDDPDGKGEISDATLLSNGNVLLAHQFAVKLVGPDKKVIWNYDAPKGNEIHTAQMIGKNHVLFIRNGDPALLKVVNIVTGETRKEFPLLVKNPKSVHGQFRHARLTSAGTIVVAHMDMAKVAEYDANGKEILSIPAENPWGVTPLKNENLLIVDRSGIREVNRKGESVWTCSKTDLSGYTLSNLQLAWRLPNGNTLINNWVNQWSGPVDKATAPVQALEVSPDKKVVWALRSWNEPDLGPATTIQILDEADAPENVSFGDIK